MAILLHDLVAIDRGRDHPTLTLVKRGRDGHGHIFLAPWRPGDVALGISTADI